MCSSNNFSRAVRSGSAFVSSALMPGVRTLMCALLLFASSLWAQSPEAPISLRFQQIELRAALQILAEYAGVNLIASDAVSGDLTLELDDVHWREAFDLILAINNLQVREQGGTLMVAPAGQLHTQDLVKRVFAIRFAQAESLKDLLQLGPQGSGVVDERTNTLILTDAAEALAEHAQLIERLDVPAGQVLIEARVLIASEQASKQLGVTWLGAAQVDLGQDGTLTLGRAEDSGQPVRAGSARLVDLASNKTHSRFGVGFLGPSGMLDVEISALETSGDAEIIAKPRVVTTNREKAVVRSGVQIPYQESTSSGATSTAFQSATLSLEVTPLVASEEQVVLTLKISQDSVGALYDGVPSINTNAIETRVLVRSGETLVLGGVYQNDIKTSVSRTPLLGRVPGLGRLFRRTISSDDRRELLVFLTPEVLVP